jgi:hypothetical protein
MMSPGSVYLSLIICALFLTSFRWPVEAPVITSTFGEARSDHFHDGVDVVSPSAAVYPLAAGKLLYFWDRSLFPGENYPGGGNYAVIDHGTGVLSVYMHLQDGVRRAREYSEQDRLGSIGDTGRSYGNHLHFTILHQGRRTSINPLINLPAVEDTMPPVIDEFAVMIDDRLVRIRDGADIRLTRHYPLYVSAVDSITGRERLGVYRLKGSLNGADLVDAEFREITFAPEGLKVGTRTFGELLDPSRFYIIGGGRFREGANHLRVVAADFAGNETVREFTFNVRLDLQEFPGGPR